VSRRQHTTLILQVRIPVPAGKTQAQTLQFVKDALLTQAGISQHSLAFNSQQTQVKITGRETTYL